MAPQPVVAGYASGVTPELRTWNLALCFQEVFTAAVRVRYGRQKVASVDAFRNQLKQALQSGEQDARQHGYTAEDARVALFAVVTFVDESILNSDNPLFSTWGGDPLGTHYFGQYDAGEVFFHQLRKIIDRPDSQVLADLLEVFQLCLQLGYRGRYGVAGRAASGDVHAIISKVGERIRRIRGDSGPLSPRGYPTKDYVRVQSSDPVLRGFAVAAVALIILAVVLFAAGKLSLHSGLAEVGALIGTTH